MTFLERSVWTVLLLGLAMDVSGCSKKEKKEDAKITATSKKTKPAKKKAASKPKVDQELVALGDVVKTEEDFEAALEKEIVPTNLEAEVDKLEQELTPSTE